MYCDKIDQHADAKLVPLNITHCLLQKVTQLFQCLQEHLTSTQRSLGAAVSSVIVCTVTTYNMQILFQIMCRIVLTCLQVIAWMLDYWTPKECHIYYCTFSDIQVGEMGGPLVLGLRGIIGLYSLYFWSEMRSINLI